MDEHRAQDRGVDGCVGQWEHLCVPEQVHDPVRIRRVREPQQLLERADRRIDRDHPSVTDALVGGERQQTKPGADVEHRVSRTKRGRLEHAFGLGDLRRVDLPVRGEPLGPARHPCPK